MGDNDFREELSPIEELPVDDTPVPGGSGFEMPSANATDIDGPDAVMQEQASAGDVSMGGHEAAEVSSDIAMAGGLAALVASDAAYKHEGASVVSGAAKAAIEVAMSKLPAKELPEDPEMEPEPEPEL